MTRVLTKPTSRWLGIGLAVVLTAGIGISGGVEPPTAAASTAESGSTYFPRSDYYPSSGIPSLATGTSENKCLSLRQGDQTRLIDMSISDALKKYNCTARVISNIQFPDALTPERVISPIYTNCTPKESTVSVGFSDVDYVETASGSSYAKGREVSTGITITKSFDTPAKSVFGGVTTDVSVSNSLSHSWTWTDSYSEAVQKGHWTNSNQSAVLPPYSYVYYGYKDLMRQVDLLWMWTPDPKDPNTVESSVQTILVHQNIDQNANGMADLKPTSSTIFGRPIAHVVRMGPAEIKQCWDGGLPDNWKPDSPRWDPSVPYLDYVGVPAGLAGPTIAQPKMLHPQGDTMLATYPFLYSTSPANSPITRGLSEVTPVSYTFGTALSQQSWKDENVLMWGRTSGGATLQRTTAQNSLVMPSGSEVAFWVGGACTSLTADIGGSHPVNRDYEVRMTVFAIKIVDGEVQYRELKDVQVPSGGTAAGARQAASQLTVALNSQTEAVEAVAIRVYRPDGKMQNLAAEFPERSIAHTAARQIFAGNRDTTILSNPKISCTPDKKSAEDPYASNSYVAEITNVTASLAASMSEQKADPYLNLRPMVTPTPGHSDCRNRDDAVGKSCNGTPTTTNSHVYTHAIGLHASTQVDWGLTPPTCHALKFGLAYDDAIAHDPNRKPVDVQVLVDDAVVKTVRLLARPDTNTIMDVAQQLTPGPHTIRLVLSAQPNDATHVNVIEPRLDCKAQVVEVNPARPTTPAATYEYVPLGEMGWSGEEGQYPASRNLNPFNGGTITIGRVSYPKGVAVHSPSKFDVRISRTDCDVFLADVGVMDTGLEGTVVFEAWNGDKLLAQSRTMKAGEAPAFFSVNVRGVKSLTLRMTDSGDNNRWDHAAWGDARFGCASPKSSSPKPDPTPTPTPAPTPSPSPGSPTKTVGVSTVRWDENVYGYRPATPGKNLDTGAPVSIGGRTFTNAIAAVSQSTIGIALDGKCTQFTALVGVDDYAGQWGTLMFEVWDGNNRRLATTPLMRGGDTPISLSADIGGASYIRLVVSDGGDGLNSDHAVWGDPMLTCSSDAAILQTRASITRYIADMAWRSAEGAAARPNYNFLGTGPVKINGTEYKRGIGTHSWSTIRVPIRECTKFNADIGIDDTAGNSGYVLYQVWGDSTKLWEQEVSGAMAAVPVDLNVSGYSELALTVGEVNNDYSWDHASWGDPRLTCLE